MTIYRSVKLRIGNDGQAAPTHSTAVRGYAKQCAVIEIIGVPDKIPSDEVARRYNCCVILPVMHAEDPLPWYRIQRAEQGDIIRLNRGRPPKNDKSVRINITLSPAALEILDGRGAGRSQEIERLILQSASTPNAG